LTFLVIPYSISKESEKGTIMNVSLTPELEELVNDKVASGMYHSASEVIREGLRLLKEQDALREIRRDELRKEVQKGIDSVARGEFAEYDGEGIAHLADAVKAEGRRRKAAPGR
jgi:antitoxin ParD1/3/4